ISCRPQKAGIGRVVGLASLPSTLGVAAAAMFGTGKSVVRIITYSGQNCGERGTMQFLSPSLVDRCDPQEIAVCAVVNRATNDNYLGLITRLIQSGSAGTLRATSRAKLWIFFPNFISNFLPLTVLGSRDFFAFSALTTCPRPIYNSEKVFSGDPISHSVIEPILKFCQGLTEF